MEILLLPNRRLLMTWKGKGNSHLTCDVFPSLLLFDCGVWFWASDPWSLNRKRTVVWKLHWLTQPLSGAAFLFSSLPLLSFRFQPVSVSFAQGTGGLPRFHEMTVHDIYGDSSHAVQCIFYCTKDQQELEFYTQRWKISLTRAGHSLSISFYLVAFLFVFLTDVLDLNNLIIFQLNFAIVNIVPMVQN